MKFEFVFDFWGPIRKIIQKIYDVKLMFKWSGRNYINYETSFEFIEYALKNLPNGSFIVFDFNDRNDKFVQFANENNNLVMDIPMWITNEYFDQKENLKKILLEAGVQKSDFGQTKTGKDKKELKVYFGLNYNKASKATILIINKMFNIPKPCIFDYTTANLSYIIPSHVKR